MESRTVMDDSVTHQTAAATENLLGDWAIDAGIEQAAGKALQLDVVMDDWL